MKKLTALLLALTLALGMTACGGSKNEAENNEPAAVTDDTAGKAAVDILNDVWAEFGEEEAFAVVGGYYDHMVENEAGTAKDADGDTLDQMFGFPSASADLIDDAASMMHMMNQNTFTAAVYHVTEADKLEALAADMKDNILNRQWMCGFPDGLVIYSVGDNYLAAAFGSEMNIDNFGTHLTETFGSAELLYNENLNF